MEKAQRKAARDAYRRQQREAAWARLGLTRAELDSLYDYLDPRLGEQGCDHSNRFTQEWALTNRFDWPRLEEALAEAGGYCDCEVIFNTDPDETF